MIGDVLEEDDTLKERPPLAPDDISKLLCLGLNCIYFLFQEEYYLQIHGSTMGSAVSLIVCATCIWSIFRRRLWIQPHIQPWC